MRHDGHPPPLICAGVGIHLPHIVYQNRLGQELFRDVFRPSRVAGHENRLCNLAFFGRIVLRIDNFCVLHKVFLP